MQSGNQGGIADCRRCGLLKVDNVQTFPQRACGASCLNCAAALASFNNNHAIRQTTNHVVAFHCGTSEPRLPKGKLGYREHMFWVHEGFKFSFYMEVLETEMQHKHCISAGFQSSVMPGVIHAFPISTTHNDTPFATTPS